MEHGEGSFDNGLKLFEEWWKPAGGRPAKATLVIVHGLKDHSARFGVSSRFWDFVFGTSESQTRDTSEIAAPR